MYLYIKKRNRIGGLFHCEIDSVVEIVDAFFMVVKPVLIVCPYNEYIVYESVLL